jgi:hypothetical protein
LSSVFLLNLKNNKPSLAFFFVFIGLKMKDLEKISKKTRKKRISHLEVRKKACIFASPKRSKKSEHHKTFRIARLGRNSPSMVF